MDRSSIKLVPMCKYQACYQAVALDSCDVLLFTSLLVWFWGGMGMGEEGLVKVFIINRTCFQHEMVVNILT